MSPIKKIFFYFLACALFMIVFFAVGEVCFRIFRKEANPLSDIIQKDRKVLFDPNTEVHSRSSIVGEFDYTAHINKFGYRGKDFEKVKPKGLYRIFIVGDSFTFGVGSQDNETIPFLIEEKLKKEGLPVEVVNAGIGHSSPVTHYLNLRDIHLQYHPDLVVLLFDMTDLHDDWRSERQAIFDKNGDILRLDPLFKNGKRDLWATAMAYSAFCRYANTKLVRTFRKIQQLGIKQYLKVLVEGKRAKAAIAASKTIDSEDVILEHDGLFMMRGQERKALIDKHWVRTAKYLTKIKDLLAKEHIPLVIGMYPHGIYVSGDQWKDGRLTWGFEAGKRYTDLYPFELVGNFAKEQRVPYVNTLGAFLNAKEEKFFFDWDGHLTPAGNRIVSQAIVDSRALQEGLKTVGH